MVAFLHEHSDGLEGVVGVGNTTFGEYFCEGAKIVSTAFQVPIVTMIDLLPGTTQEHAIKSFLGRDEEEEEE